MWHEKWLKKAYIFKQRNTIMGASQQQIKNLRVAQKSKLAELAKQKASKEKIIEERKRMASQLKALRLIDKTIAKMKK
jgi:hypothetical protein